jgi:CxxC-x17-CxxC domain-containing protein
VSDIDFKNLKEFNQKTFADEVDLFDKHIVCIDCGEKFLWTIGEQVFFRDKGLRNPPKRCRKCKLAKNERIASIAAAQAAGVKQRIEVAVYCARCNEYTTVPFYPSQGRPVFCRSCFIEMNPGVLPPNGHEEEEDDGAGNK